MATGITRKPPKSTRGLEAHRRELRRPTSTAPSQDDSCVRAGGAADEAAAAATVTVEPERDEARRGGC